MSSTASPVSATPKPRRWLRRLGLGIGGLLALLVVLYFVVTSGAFFKGVILPKVGAALNAQVTVSDASISPFSQVTLRDLKVLTTGAEPLVTAQEVRARYSLWDIIGGNLKISEVTLESPTVTLITHADGTSNLDPITQAPKAIPADEKKQPAPDPAAKPLQIDLGKFALNNATVRVITEHQGGGARPRGSFRRQRHAERFEERPERQTEPRGQHLARQQATRPLFRRFVESETGRSLRHRARQ
jgi:uncharacterized protein involved in outer membrane biogenesis